MTYYEIALILAVLALVGLSDTAAHVITFAMLAAVIVIQGRTLERLGRIEKRTKGKDDGSRYTKGGG